MELWSAESAAGEPSAVRGVSTTATARHREAFVVTRAQRSRDPASIQARGRALYNGAMKIKELMAVDVPALDPDASLEEAAALMDAGRTGILPIVENGRVAGVVTDRDIVVRALAKGLAPDDTAVGDIMTYELVCCHEEDDARVAAELMARHGVKRVLVLDREGCLRGLVSHDWLTARAPGAARLLEQASLPLAGSAP